MGFQTAALRSESAALRSESAALRSESAAVASESAALGFSSAAFCRDARFRVSSSDRAIYPPCRVLPRSPLSRPRFMGVFTPVAAPPRRIRASLGPARFTRVANATPSPPKPPVLPRSLGLRFCRGARFRKPPRAATTDRAAPRSVVVRGRVPQASPSRGTILAVRRE